MYGSQKGPLGSPGTFTPADGNVDEKKTWYGANLYLTYAITDVFSLGFRGEHFDNTSGARGLNNVDSNIEMMIKAVIIVLAVAVQGQGTRE